MNTIKDILEAKRSDAFKACIKQSAGEYAQNRLKTLDLYLEVINVSKSEKDILHGIDGYVKGAQSLLCDPIPEISKGYCETLEELGLYVLSLHTNNVAFK